MITSLPWDEDKTYNDISHIKFFIELNGSEPYYTLENHRQDKGYLEINHDEKIIDIV
jgi:hypothetical protein